MKFAIAPGRQWVSTPDTLEFIAAALRGTADAGLPAGESVTIELTSTGNVRVIRQDGTNLTYQHPRARIAAAIKAHETDAAQLKLAM